MKVKITNIAWDVLLKGREIFFWSCRGPRVPNLAVLHGDRTNPREVSSKNGGSDLNNYKKSLTLSSSLYVLFQWFPNALIRLLFSCINGKI